MTRPVWLHDDVHLDVAARLLRLVSGSGLSLDQLLAAASGGPVCPVLDFAASGAMALTGHADGPPVALDAPVITQVRVLCAAIALLGARVGAPVALDPYAAVTGRARHRGFTRRGSTSTNGSCRLLRAGADWLAVSLPRPSDFEMVPAVVGGPVEGDAWEALERSARARPAAELAGRARLLGLAAAPLPTSAGSGGEPPFRVEVLGSPGAMPAPGRRGEPLVVVDFSALWAGPLCAHVLGATGATVIKVEDPDRPDGARHGDPELFRSLHDGHRIERVAFDTDGGDGRIHGLVDGADVVVEASRPRALERLGLSPEEFLAGGPGRSWVSITGYGRRGPGADLVAFGDDAAVAGGLVGWSGGGPVFCADAVADPLAGLYAAVGALFALCAGGGLLVDVSMRAAGASVMGAATCPGSHGVEHDASGKWHAHHNGRHGTVVVPVACSA